MDELELSRLKDAAVPEPTPGARARAVALARAAYADEQATQGSGIGRRLKTIFNLPTWRWTMERRMAMGAAAASFAVIAVGAQFALEHGQGRFNWSLPSLEEGQSPDDGALPVGGNELDKDTAGTGTAANQVVGAAPGEASEDAVGRLVLTDRARQQVRGDELRESEAVVAMEPVPLPSAAPPVAHRAAPGLPIAQYGLTGSGSRSAGGVPLASMPAPAADALPPAPQYEGRDQFTDFEVNPVRTVTEHPVSTFSVDVDTASYAFVRRMLREGRLPPEDAVRVEEMINYFDYDYPAAASASEPFAPTVAVYPTPWNDGTQIMHVGIKGFEIAPDAKPRSNLVFLLDVSGSMESADKLPLLKSAFRLLLDNLDPEDTVSIVTYAGNAGTVLEPTEVSERRKIMAAIEHLGAGGSTAGAAGIEAAYALAEEAYVEGGINRVILATDGDFNVGISDPDELEDYIERRRESGVYLSVLGFGAGNYNDALMQALAQSGNGNAAYIDTLNEARKVLVDEAGSTLVPIAGDVKIQVEFNPATVAEYRLIGYETRTLNREDFNNDRVDAGDIGSGHTVTAIYEITPTDSPARLVDDLRYQSAAPAPVADPSDEFAFLRLRYKLPGESESRLIERPVTGADEVDGIAQASDDMRFAAAVAAFGQKLRAGTNIGDFGYDEIADLAAGARGGDPFGYRNEFLSLVRLADALDGNDGR